MNAHADPTRWNGATPPDYVAVYMRRAQILKQMRADKNMLVGALEHYGARPGEFINTWCDTFDPRSAFDPELLPSPPFVLFPRQWELVEFLHQLLLNQVSGLIEKARDMGATWVCVGFSVWAWRFVPGAAIGWGSRKQDLVDQIGDPKSIFEKIRQCILGLPREFWPKGFNPRVHMASMRIINPENGASIIGEIGDEIGRGGRTLMYFKDESAHYERPERIEAALGNNTRVQVDISSVKGTGNVFHRRRMAGVVWTPGKEMVSNRANVFIMDWSENPLHTQKWYDDMRSKHEAEGILHVFEQEVNRNYSASVEGIIIPAAWVTAAKDAHKRFPEMLNGTWRGGFDPYNEGRDKHALVRMKGSVIRFAETWAKGDTGEATRKVVSECRGHAPFTIQFDSIGVGAGVTAEANRLEQVGEMPKGMKFVAFVASAKVQDPDGAVEGDADTNSDGVPILNKDMFKNLKAQAGWSLRRRFERTYRAVHHNEVYDPDDMISIDTELIRPDMLAELERQLSQPTRKPGSLKLVIDKTPDGSDSPNLFDAAMIAAFPVETGYVYDLANAL